MFGVASPLVPPPRGENRSRNNPGTPVQIKEKFMKHTSRRRAAGAVVTFAAVAGTLLAAGGAASAATNPEVGRTAVVASYSSHSGAHGDERGEHRDFRGDDGGEYRHHWGDHRWDGDRNWEQDGRYWYSDDHGVRYRCGGLHFYRWDYGRWILVTDDTHRFDVGFFR
jgi:hypothetical protein